MKGWIGFLLLIISHPLFSEVQYAQIRWNPAHCVNKCPETIAQQLKIFPGIASLTMNPTAGQADLIWKPDVPFLVSYLANIFAQQRVTVYSIRIKVRGTIQVFGNQVSLLSLGDNTTFSLVSAPKIQINRNQAYYNPANYPLDPYLKDQLAKAANEKKIVHIEGPLLAPDSALSLMLIPQNVQQEP